MRLAAVLEYDKMKLGSIRLLNSVAAEYSTERGSRPCSVDENDFHLIRRSLMLLQD